MPPPLRILVLTSSTGGGHNTRARALQTWAERQPAVQVHIFQTLESLHPLYRFGVNLYNAIQKIQPRLHHLYFNFLEWAHLHRKKTTILGKKRFREELAKHQPHVLFSTHAHLNHGFFELARQQLPSIKCVTYCGELFGGYGFSRHWVNPNCDLFIGAVQETCVAAAKWGMSPEKNWRGGFLLDPAFYDPPSAPCIKEELNLRPHQFVLLLASGTNGASHHLRLLKALPKTKNLQVIALCGKNKSLQTKIESWAKKNPPISVKTLPSVPQDKMSQLLSCSSAVVARPGTGLTSEAILRECPLFFDAIGGLMPQEQITVKYFRAHGIKKNVIYRPRDLAILLKNINSASLRPLKPKEHPLDILEKIITL